MYITDKNEDQKKKLMRLYVYFMSKGTLNYHGSKIVDYKTWTRSLRPYQEIKGA